MSDQTPPTTTAAESPFDDANADVILRTSDHVDFRVYRLVLTLSSLFFQSTLTHSQPSDDTTNDAPTAPTLINVAEDSHTLNVLLRGIYPNTKYPSFANVQSAGKVAVAAARYGMRAALAKIAERVETTFVQSDPLPTYFLACRMGWKSVARAAAKKCVDQDITAFVGANEDAVNRSLLDFKRAGIAYYNLERYRCDYRMAIQQRLHDMALFRDYKTETSCDAMHGAEGDTISQHCLKRWTELYLDNFKEAVLQGNHAYAFDEPSQLCPDLDCGGCDLDLAISIATARSDIAFEIDRVLEQVRQVQKRIVDGC